MPEFIPTFDRDPGLTAEAQAVVQEAAAPMEKWINDSLSALQADFTKRVQEATKDLEAQARAIPDDLKTMRDQLAQLITDLNTAHADLPATAPEDLLDSSKKLASEVLNFLKQREDKWRNAGANVTKAIETAAKGLVG